MMFGVSRNPQDPRQPDNTPQPGGDYDYRDALPDGPARRRGAGLNPGNRFEPHRVHILGEELDRQEAERYREGQDGKPINIPLQVLSDQTKKVINRVAKTSDVPFDWTLNPYRGCEHGCIYCYARPYHEYLGFSCGLDFETKIVAKHDAPRMLIEELAHPKWKAEPIVMSAITDVYQPIERELELTRQCLQIMADCRQPVNTMTKGALVLRDLDLWQQLARINAGRVTVTLATLDDALAKLLEPRAASPARRLHVIRELSKAGVSVTVNIAPVIPALTDREMPAILEAVAEAGARRCAWVLLRLPWQLKELFDDWLERHFPDRRAHVLSLMRQASHGKLYDSSYKHRRRGDGPLMKQIAQLFDIHTRRYGLNRNLAPLSNRAFRRPSLNGQMWLC